MLLIRTVLTRSLISQFTLLDLMSSDLIHDRGLYTHSLITVPVSTVFTAVGTSQVEHSEGQH